MTKKRVSVQPGGCFHTPDCPEDDRRKWTKALCGVRIDKPEQVLPDGSQYPRQCKRCLEITAKTEERAINE